MRGGVEKPKMESKMKSELKIGILAAAVLMAGSAFAEQTFIINRGYNDGTYWKYTLIDTDISEQSGAFIVDGGLTTDVDVGNTTIDPQTSTIYDYNYDKATRELVNVLGVPAVGTTEEDWAVTATVDADGTITGITELDNMDDGVMDFDPTIADHFNTATDSAVVKTGGNLGVGGNVVIDGTLTVGGVEISQAVDSINATTLTEAKNYADTGDVDTLADAKGYADTGDADTLTAAKGYADTGDADTLTDAKGYADTGDADTLTDAKGYADTGDATTLTAAKGYADTGAADTLTDAKGYADSGDADTLTDAKGYADTGDADTLTDSKSYADTGDADTLADAKSYADTGDADTLTDAKSYADVGDDVLAAAIDDEVLARIAAIDAIDSITGTGAVLGATEVGIAGLVTLDMVTEQIHLGSSSFVFDEFDAAGHRMFTSDGTDLVLGGGANSTDVVVDGDLDVVGNANFQQNLNVAGDVFVNGRQGLQSQVDGNRYSIDKNARNIEENRSLISQNAGNIDQNTRGIAMAAALTHTTVLPGMDNALDVSAATFAGETGLAITYSRRVNENIQLNFGAATTTDLDESIVRAGVGVQW